MGVVHGGGWFIRSSHVALIYSPKPRIYFIHYAFVGAEGRYARLVLAAVGVGHWGLRFLVSLFALAIPVVRGGIPSPLAVRAADS